MDIEDLIIPPSTISLLTTYACTAECKNCCFKCNPKIKERLSLNKMKRYIDQCIATYPKFLQVLVLTGGECFLLGKDLVKVIEHGASKGLIVRIVTNGYWAKSYIKSHSMLTQLVDAGLKEINFSTGDDHQEWVPYDNIVHGCMASIDLGLTCVVNVESHDSSIFDIKRFFEDDRLKKYFIPNEKTKKYLKIEKGVWVPFRKDSQLSYDSIELNQSSHQRCTSLFNTLAINPYSVLIACCGLTSEYISCLRLGNVEKKSIKEIYENQFFDFIKIWLFTEGPAKILEFIYKKRNIKHEKISGHICQICAEVFKDPKNIDCIKKNYSKIAPSILLKYSFMQKSTYQITKN